MDDKDQLIIKESLLIDLFKERIEEIESARSLANIDISNHHNSIRYLDAKIEVLDYELEQLAEELNKLQVRFNKDWK